MHDSRLLPHPSGSGPALTLYRQTTLLGECPGELRAQVATLNLDLSRAVDVMIERRFGTLDDRLRLLTRAAIQETPYGLVRPYIGSAQDIPAWLTDAVAAAVPAMPALGDTWQGDARPRGDAAQASR